MPRVCFTKLAPNNHVVQSGLAITPSQIYERVKKGIPVGDNFSNDSQFIDGDENCGYEVPIVFRRGVDINTLWNEQEDSRAALKSINVNQS